MTIGAICEIKVANPKALDDEIIHMVPNRAMVERLKLEGAQEREIGESK